MRIIIMSDSHGDFFRVRQVFEENPGAACYIHLGDGARDFEEAGWLFPDTSRMSVQGNCDFGRDEPSSGLVELGGKRIFFTHGHQWGVKQGLEDLIWMARQQKADIALYGHTHRAEALYQDGLWLINPGSLRDSRETPPGYLALDITPAGVVPVLRTF